MRKIKLWKKIISAAAVLSLAVPAVPGQVINAGAKTAADGDAVQTIYDGIMEDGGNNVTAHLEENGITFDSSDQSLNQYQVPEWYRDAKFGIFIHYGIYSVPAFGDEWYGHWMYMPGTLSYGGSNIYQYHQDTYGGAAAYGYKNFIPSFVTELQKYKSNNMAQEWAALFSKAGAKYVMPVGIHHDSFALYDSDVQTTYNSVAQADVDYVADLQAAVKEQGMKFGISNHFAENDWFFDEGAAVEGSDIKDTKTAADEMYGDGKTKSSEHIHKWYNISMEIINKYHPDMIYYDFDLDQTPFLKYDDANRNLMLANYYNQAQIYNPDGVVCNFKGTAFSQSQAVLEKERTALAQINPSVWQTDTSIGKKSWGYTTDEVYRNGEEFIGALVDIVSKNGNLLLNVGPKADGTIPDDAEKALLTLGEWLDTYGDAVYGTRPWIVCGEGPTQNTGDSYALTEKDIRFTKSKDGTKLYATALAAPESSEMKIKTLNSEDFDGTQIKSISLINGAERTALTYTQDGGGLNITVPKDEIHSAYAVEISFVNDYIPALSTDVRAQTEASNYYQAAEITVENCTDDGSDMVRSDGTAGAYAKYLLELDTDNKPQTWIGRFSNDSSGSVEIRLGGETGTLLGTVTLENAGADGYRTVPQSIDMSSVNDKKMDLCLVFKGDIKLSWFKMFNRSVGSVIEAEDYDDKSGTCQAEMTNDPEGGNENIGYVSIGDFLVYNNVDFGEGANGFTLRMGSGQNGGVEVRIDASDGTVICQTTDTNTGHWDNYKTFTFPLKQTVQGYHDVYIKFKSVANLNWFKFEREAPAADNGSASDNNESTPDNNNGTAPDNNNGAASDNNNGSTSDNNNGAAPDNNNGSTSDDNNESSPDDDNTSSQDDPEENYAAARTLTVKAAGYLGKNITLVKGKKITLKSKVSPSKAKQGVTYKSSDSKVASVSKTGVVTAKGAGKAKITIQSSDKGKTVVYTINVVKKAKTVRKISVKKKSVVLKKGKTYQISLKNVISGTDKITYSSENKKYVKVDKYGLISGVEKGRAAVKVKCGKANAKISVTVK